MNISNTKHRCINDVVIIDDISLDAIDKLINK